MRHMVDSDRVLAILNHVSTQISGVDGLENVLLKLVKAANELLDGVHVGIWYVDRNETRLRLGEGYPAAALNAMPELVRLGEGVIGSAAQTQQPITGKDWRVLDDRFVQHGYRSGLALPLVWQAHVEGVLIVAASDAERTFTDVELYGLGVIGSQAAMVLSSARAERAVAGLTHTISDEQSQLIYIQAAIRQMLEEPDVNINLIEMARAVQALGWQRVIVALFADGEQVERVFVAGGEGDEEQYRVNVIPADLWQQLMAGSLEIYRMGGVYFVPHGDHTQLAWSVADLVFVPLRLGQDRVSGIIRLEGPLSGLRPTRETLRSVDILTGQAAYIVENARLLNAASDAAEALAEQVEELSMMHRADRELGTNLDTRRIMTLTMDWALRRTGAESGMLLLIDDNKRGLIPSIKLGYIDPSFSYDEHNPVPLGDDVVGRAVYAGETQVVLDASETENETAFFAEANSQLAVPISMRGEVLGVIILASTREGMFGETEVSFLERLGRRAAVALDNARLFRQAEQMADDMTLLYTASRAITSTLEQDAMLQRIAQAITVTLECSSAVMFNYQADVGELEVRTVYRLGTAHDAQEVLPELNERIPVTVFPAMELAVEQEHPVVLRAADPAVSSLDRQYLIDRQIYVLILMPLLAQNEIIGLVGVYEGRRDRLFSSSDVFKAETMASQAAVALRQSMLYSEVSELGKIKSEMIRMASHDLRNPLNNIMGYVELMAMSMERQGIAPEQVGYLNNLRRGTKAMQSLLEDLLTLERIESERRVAWTPLDLSGLVYEVVESQRSSANLKDQTLEFMRATEPAIVIGSETQLRQAVANLVGNAIKYTPDEGHIKVEFWRDDDRLHFLVKDNGYGISPERQKRLFERFYRAQEPGTDHIGGTGLGLSLVKTVIERHGGQVWFESQSGVGSMFGFWLPSIEAQ